MPPSVQPVTNAIFFVESDILYTTSKVIVFEEYLEDRQEVQEIW